MRIEIEALSDDYGRDVLVLTNNSINTDAHVELVIDGKEYTISIIDMKAAIDAFHEESKLMAERDRLIR